MFAILVAFVTLWLLWNHIQSLFRPTVLDNIPGPPADSWLTGSFHKLMSHMGWDFHRSIAETYGGVACVKGLLGANMLYVHDPKALHHILVKDLNVFEEQDLFIEGNRMFFGEGIFTSLGERHRLHRKMLNPVFSTSHMREMINIFYEVAHKLERTFLKIVENGPQQIDLVAWNTRLSLELIAQSGLEYTFDTLEEGTQPHPYAVAAKELAPAATDSWITLIQTIALPIIAHTGTPKLRRWILDALPFKPLHKIRDIVDTLHATSVEIYESKKKAFEAGDGGSSGKDIISILLKENLEAVEEEKLSEKEILGQITSLTFAATDTTSGALSRTLYQLAVNKDVQANVRAEIREARKANHGHDIGYDELMALPLLDAVIKETLRLFPPVVTLSRIAREDAVLPLATPIKGIDGKYIEEIPVPEGTEIYISILASNKDPQTWGPDSYEWKPERWLNPLPEALINAKVPGVYSHMLTFLGGGRSCIGFKFSQLEMKVVLALLLENLEFTATDKKIVWLMSNICTPNIEGFTDPVPTMPMVISKAK